MSRATAVTSDPRRIVHFPAHVLQVLVAVADAVVGAASQARAKGDDKLVMAGGVGDATPDRAVVKDVFGRREARRGQLQVPLAQGPGCQAGAAPAQPIRAPRVQHEQPQPSAGLEHAGALLQQRLRVARMPQQHQHAVEVRAALLTRHPMQRVQQFVDVALRDLLERNIEYGGEGADVLKGGQGKDVYVFDGIS